MIYLHRLIEDLIIPPSSSLLFILLGLLVLKNRTWWGRGLISLGIASLYLASTPVFVNPLTEYWLSRYPMVDLQTQNAQAIVVLGGGRRGHADEYGGETINSYAMERLRYAALLHRQTGLPILVTGGSVYTDERTSEAELMRRFLLELGVTPRWLEDRSRTTYENALYSVPILKASHINRVLLVTHGVHMPRSVWSFEKLGMDVIPAPTVFHAYGSRGGIREYIPRASTLDAFAQILHEWLGLAWYRLSK